MYGIAWGSAYVSGMVWIDCIFAVLLGGLHAYTWTSTAGEYANEEHPAQVARTLLSSTIMGGITAVGILLPVTLIAVQIARPSAFGLANIFFADSWFVLSLLFGLYGLFSVGVRGAHTNVLNRLDVGLVYGWQLISLAVGIVRLLVGVFLVFSGGR